MYCMTFDPPFPVSCHMIIFHKHLVSTWSITGLKRVLTVKGGLEYITCIHFTLVFPDEIH